MASGSNTKPEKGKSPIKEHDDGHKMPRHPRWARHETLILIEGKNSVEARGREGRRSGPVSGPSRVEPKWDAISSYCKQNGVSRGPVQCRKRWSNLLSDFKKIKTWESVIEDGRSKVESFWTMRSDLRRERRLPSLFDREVYDVMENGVFKTPEYQLALVTANVDEDNSIDHDIDGVEEENEMEDEETNPDDLFSGFNRDVHSQIRRNLGKEKVEMGDKMDEITSPVPISEMRYRAFPAAYINQGNETQSEPNFWKGSEFEERVKRRRPSPNDSQNDDVDSPLIKFLERTINVLSANLEEIKLNRRVEREQQKEQHDSLMAALGKITDAIGKIANKL